MSDLNKRSISKHPCYNIEAHNYARMHVPVAPDCNILCNYCNRKYDCANECRPGVTSQVLSPREALEKYKYVKNQLKNLTVLGIAGPGDALANFDKTKETIERIKEYDPEVIFCLSTNGLMLPDYAEEIINLGVEYVTITINAIDPLIGANIYRKINYKNKEYSGKEGAKILIDNQLEGLKYLSDKGVFCKINTVFIKTINDDHIEKLVIEVKNKGAFMTNIMPLIPVKGSFFEHMPIVSNKELYIVRENCKKYIKQMSHCRQCRADAIGKLSHDISKNFEHKCYTHMSDNILTKIS
ncbi:nitrogenase cofactor biosynthesis protein NifB [Defluviitalea phaphyphila]|uniref:nitrogenase cofactor biosynthesis protein NifB n=1 Tax=Defluviitalea phaphyphila TaxID=1473580 RepID=UPI000731BED5|nr:nitrogenase cofactor biosynthesis protein NifB [Defluviitalea phaphyphila]